MTRASEWEHSTIFVWQSEVAIFARKFGCMHLACTLSSFPHHNKITSPRAYVLLFRKRKSWIFISCSPKGSAKKKKIIIIIISDWLYANEFVLGVRNCSGKNNRWLDVGWAGPGLSWIWAGLDLAWLDLILAGPGLAWTWLGWAWCWTLSFGIHLQLVLYYSLACIQHSVHHKDFASLGLD